MTTKKVFICYNITKNPKTQISYWNRIGTAFQNRDGSFNIQLDSFPVSGNFQIREYKPKDSIEFVDEIPF